MAYIMLPQQERTKTGGEAFLEGSSQYLQMAFQAMLQRKMADMQRQRNIEQSQQMFPEAFTQPSYEELARQRGMPIQGLQYPQALPQDQREAFYKDIYTRKFGAEIPAKYKKFSLQKAQQYPGFGIDFTTGGMEYKVPQPLAPTYLYNPSTGQVEPMTLPTGEPIPPKAKVITKPESPEEKQQREVETAQMKAEIPTADIKNLAKQSELQLENVRALKREASKLPGGYEGIGLRGLAIATRGVQGGDLYAYERKLPAFAAGLYRALTGDNRLSDMDAQQRALPLLWNTSIDISLREPMFSFLEKALEVRKRLLSERRYTQTQEGDIVTPLETVLQETQQIIQQPQEQGELSLEALLAEKQRRMGR